MRPNSRRHDEYAPHVRTPSASLPGAQAPGQGAGTASTQRRSRGRRKRTQPPVAPRPQNLTEQPEVRSAVEAALARDDSVATGDE